jgi:hypothetical protein
MVQQRLLRLAATLGFLGFVFFEVVSAFHPDGANDHKAAFANYAASADWTAIHLGQFVGIASLLAGLLVLFYALNLEAGAPRWLGVFGALAAVVTVPLAAIVYAVDGVALKQAVDAWANAPAAEQGTRFASAEAIRWLEWGTKSYQDFMFGLALLLFGAVIVWTARVPRPIGVLLALAGLAYVGTGWVFGAAGFAPDGMVPSDAAQVFLPLALLWLLVVAWRWKAPVPTALSRPTAVSS